ncbi:monooxygenase protein [Spatholobus suberectus]|nr:monooxygenase protein [Spatholobus suberectus]
MLHSQGLTHGDPISKQLLSMKKPKGDGEPCVGPLVWGYETTAKLLSLIVYFLGGASNALERLKEEHQEIRKRKKEGELLNWEDYKQMEFTQKVMYEAMRCGNVVKYLHRKAVQDVKFKDYVIPAGWKVLPVLSSGHLDPTLLKILWSSIPFGGMTSTSKKAAPFGGGPRLCPGADLAKVETAFFLHHLVLNYRWKIKPDDPHLLSRTWNSREAAIGS